MFKKSEIKKYSSKVTNQVTKLKPLNTLKPIIF